jgi:hypothetical protein
MDETPKPWYRRPQEPARPYRLFKIFLELGEGRTLGAVVETDGEQAEDVGRRAISRRTVERYSSRWHWIERSHAYDADGLMEEIKGRVRIRERTKQTFYGHAADAAAVVLGLMRGEMPMGDKETILDRHQKIIGERAMVSASVRLQAAQHVLGMAGLILPKRIELDQADGDELRLQARQALGALPIEIAHQLLEALQKRHGSPERVPPSDAPAS